MSEFLALTRAAYLTTANIGTMTVRHGAVSPVMKDARARGKGDTSTADGSAGGQCTSCDKAH